MAQQYNVWHEPWGSRFRDLMPFVVREILLVSSAYDAFILEEDGPLAERLFAEYSELSLLICPKIICVDSVAQAMELLEDRHFDLVMITPRLEGTDIDEFGKMVKSLHQDIPVVMLAFDESDLESISSGVDETVIDEVFLWSGNARILFAIIKYVEDKKNVLHDTQIGGVRIILVVEDSVRSYSTILATLYSEVLKHSQAINTETMSTLHKMLRLRSRPKIILAKNYEAAVKLCETYLENILGLITDMRFPLNGKLEPTAGIKLASWIRERIPDLPILFESMEPSLEKTAKEMKAAFVSKKSQDFFWQIGNFFKEYLGFGDFVFMLPNGKKIGRARDFKEMELIFRRLKGESLVFHAERNDFSRWLNARSMFGLAAQIKPFKADSFDSVDEIREFLIDIVSQARTQEEGGAISDYSPSTPHRASILVRMGMGSMGGKGRGIAFVNSLIASHIIPREIDGLRIRIPKTVVIGSDEYDRFLEGNFLAEKVATLNDDKKIGEIFHKSQLSPRFLRDLRSAVDSLNGPLAVRSSSLLEDSRFLSFAGIYRTYLLPNSHSKRSVRFEDLRGAIKAVYSSIYSKEAREFFPNTPYRAEDEKMAVVVQEVVGRKYGNRYYPHFAGVAMSYNYYPIGNQKPEDGLAVVALGLGQTVVAGGTALRFSPGTPGVFPQFNTAADFLKNSQSQFVALDLTKTPRNFKESETSSYVALGLEDAEADGVLQRVGSVYSHEDNTLRENFRAAGPRVVTFHNILKWNEIPLAKALQEILGIMCSAMGSAVEIEFAVDIPPRDENRAPSLYIVQVRPVRSQPYLQSRVDFGSYEPEDLLCASQRALGHGINEDIKDIIYVAPGEFNSTTSRALANEIEKYTKELSGEGRPFALIGPGRWGSSDPSLGIPVTWAQISGVKLIIETGLKDRVVDPSDGTHFFRNMTNFRIGYMIVQKSKFEPSDQDNLIDFDWLDSQVPFNQSGGVRHLRFSKGILTNIDGTKAKGVLLKP
jgi:hypothetical protein